MEENYRLAGIEKMISREEIEEALIKIRRGVGVRGAQIFKMGYYKGMTNGEIAEELGLCKNYVKTVKSRVVRLLGAYIE